MPSVCFVWLSTIFEGAFTTVTVHSACRPSAAVTTICAVPAATPLTLPFASTVQIFLFPVAKLSAVSAGSTDAFKGSV